MFRRTLLVTLTVLLFATAGLAQDEGYQLPPQVLVDLLDAPLPPAVRTHPDGTWLALLERPSQPSIAELAEPELRLAGNRIKPRTNAPSRSRHATSVTLLKVDDGTERQVSGLPAAARIEHFTWSPNGEHFAFTHTAETGVELWIGSLADASAQAVTGPILNLTMRAEPRWLADSSAVVTPVLAESRGDAPLPPRVPEGPIIQENIGEKAPARTYQDLLETPHDEALFDHYFTAQMARIGRDGEVTRLGEPAVIWNAAPSPDGRYLMVETLHRPYSYLVLASRFPRRTEIWNAAGELVERLADQPLQEKVPTAFGSVPTGRRAFQWRADADATIAWAEALDGGDAGAEAEERDRIFTLAAPFNGEPVPLVTLSQRLAQIQWHDGDLALVSSWWWKTRNNRAWRVAPDHPEREREKLFDYSWEDRYNDPGNPLMETDARGRARLAVRRGSLVLIGVGASPEGDRPFLDLFDLESKETERIFHSEAPWYERPMDLLGEPEGDGLGLLLTLREAVEEPPNIYVRDPEGDRARPRQITRFPHPTPQLKGIRKEQIRYSRADGVTLTGTLYLPAGYDAERDGPLPAVLWAYPQEFKSADAAGQVTDSPHRFVRIGWWSPLLWLTQGYAVLDDPTLPIIGEGDEEPNDTYVEQLVAGAEAAIEELARRGVGDPDRMAIGGHSYGAFMTANLLAHSDLFAAGIARSGAYNRTLTPFGFQAEERTVWQAPEIYFAMSPFMHAEKVNEPILMIHGEADNNSGTFPMQSERFYNALKGLGATARLVMLPHESHGYRARESILHMLWETHRWLDTYVKERPAAEGEAKEAAR
ncbi:MAG: prolyl oligopeptidase family serine peptidase [Acidobacteriota bacterium]